MLVPVEVSKGVEAKEFLLNMFLTKGASARVAPLAASRARVPALGGGAHAQVRLQELERTLVTPFNPIVGLGATLQLDGGDDVDVDPLCTRWRCSRWAKHHSRTLPPGLRPDVVYVARLEDHALRRHLRQHAPARRRGACDYIPPATTSSIATATDSDTGTPSMIVRPPVRRLCALALYVS